MFGDTLTGQFGTKVSSGAISVVCETVSDSTLKDYSSASGFLDSGSDTKVSDTVADLVITDTTYQPFRLRNYFSSLTASNNFVGRKGSVLYLKSVSVTIENCSFTSNGAVDAY